MQIQHSISEQANNERTLIATLMVGVFLPLLDATILNVAIQSIAQSLEAKLATTQWLVTAYALAAAAVVPICAWAVRCFGARTMWLAGLSGFLIASLSCALARNMEQLIAFRLLQGLAAGMLMPVMQTILVHAVGAAHAKRALASMAVPAVIAPILGPIVGGFILEYANWRWIFALNIPICIIGILCALEWIQRDTPNTVSSFDLFGFLIVCPGITLLVYALSLSGTTNAHSSYVIIACLLLASSALLYFVRHSLQNPGKALMDLRLFSIPTFRLWGEMLLLSSMAFYGGLILMPLYFFEQLHFSALQISLLMACQGVGALWARHYLTRISNHFGSYHTAIFASLVAIFGSVPFLISNPNTHMIFWATCALLRGAGIGIITVLALSSAYQDVDKTRISDASAITRILTNLGAALGSAICMSALSYTWRPMQPSQFFWPFFLLCAMCAMAAVRFSFASLRHKREQAAQTMS